MSNSALNSPDRTAVSSRGKVSGCSERLAGLRPKSPPQLPPLVTPRKLQKEDMERHIHSVYNASVEKKKKTLAANEAAVKHREEQMLQYGGNNQMTVSEVNEIIARLSEEQVRLKQQGDVKLLERYEAEYKQKNRTHINDPSGKDSLTAEEMKSSVTRLYIQGRQHEKEHMQKLVSQYCPERVSPRRTKAQIAAAAARLWRNEK